MSDTIQQLKSLLLNLPSLCYEMDVDSIVTRQAVLDKLHETAKYPCIVFRVMENNVMEGCSIDILQRGQESIDWVDVTNSMDYTKYSEAIRQALTADAIHLGTIHYQENAYPASTEDIYILGEIDTADVPF